MMKTLFSQVELPMKLTNYFIQELIFFATCNVLEGKASDEKMRISR